MAKTMTARWDTRRERACADLGDRLNAWMRRYRGVLADDDLIAAIHEAADMAETTFDEEQRKRSQTD